MAEQKLVKAISDRRVIRCMYRGHQRIGEPHLLGIEGDDLTLEIFQTGGGSESGGLPDWRHYKVDGITQVVALKQTFAVRPDFNVNRDRWRKIVCHVRHDAG
ncbi:MAG TPA: WYL domain-containing protein [Pirellulales bacterium]|jgi:hypothetical protein|nr:WYL domain-containing protein [Pirellulales bacterium]